MNLLVAWGLLCVGHTAGLSGGAYVVRDGVLSGRLSFHKADLQALLEGAGGDAAAALSLKLSSEGKTCRAEDFRTEAEEEDGMRVRFRGDCALSDGDVMRLELGFLDRVPSGHRHFYELHGGGALIEGVAYQGASEIKWTVQGPPRFSGRRWVLPGWLILFALGLGVSTRREVIEVFVAAAMTALLIVGAGAATAFAPRSPYLSLLASLFAFYLSADAYRTRRPPRRVALAVPGAMIAALIFLAEGLAEGAAEDRVVRGLSTYLVLAIVPGGLLLALSSALSARWPRALAGLGVLLSVAGGVFFALLE